MERMILKYKLFSALLGLIFITAMFVTPARADEPIEQQGLVDKARIIFQSFMADKDMEWFRENMNQAKGLLLIPDLLKAGLIIGGSGGKGILIVRDEKSGVWSQPAFYTIGSVTFGFQIGGEKSEIIMMIRTQKGLDSLYSSSIKLGGDISVAVGPVGGGAKSNIMADFISFVRSKGAYAGVSMEGTVIKTGDKANEAYYGKAVRPIDIIVEKTVSNPSSKALRDAVAKAYK